MKIVVDANIIFAALIKRGILFDIIYMLPKKEIEMITPDFILEEIENNKDRLLKISKLSDNELYFVLRILFKRIKIVPYKEYDNFLLEAKQLLIHHTKDVPYFALALKFNAPLWSYEKRFLEQEKVKILSTSDIKKLL